MRIMIVHQRLVINQMKQHRLTIMEITTCMMIHHEITIAMNQMIHTHLLYIDMYYVQNFSTSHNTTNDFISMMNLILMEYCLNNQYIFPKTAYE